MGDNWCHKDEGSHGNNIAQSNIEDTEDGVVAPRVKRRLVRRVALPTIHPVTAGMRRSHETFPDCHGGEFLKRSRQFRNK